MKIKAGGVLVNNGPGDIYGIQPEEFQKTYGIIEEAPSFRAVNPDVDSAPKVSTPDLGAPATQKSGNMLDFAKSNNLEGKVSYVGTYEAYTEILGSNPEMAQHIMSPPEDYRGPIIATESEYQRATTSGNPDAVRYISETGESYSGQTQTHHPKVDAAPNHSRQAPSATSEYTLIDWAKDVGADGKMKMVGTAGAYEDAVNSNSAFAEHIMAPSEDYSGPIVASKAEYERAVATGDADAVRYISLDGESYSGQTQIDHPKVDTSPNTSRQAPSATSEYTLIDWAKDVGADGKMKMVGTAGAYEDAVNSNSAFAEHIMSPSEDYRGPIIATEAEFQSASASGDPDAVRYISETGESYSGQTQTHHDKVDIVRDNTPDGASTQKASTLDVDTVKTIDLDSPSKPTNLTDTFDSVRRNVSDGGADIHVTNTKMGGYSQAGGSAAGLVMGGIGLKNAIENGDTTGIIVSGADVAVSSLDMVLDGAVVLGKNVPQGFQGIAAKANILITVADGVYQISQEEGIDNKVARGAAVTVTTGTAMAVGSAGATVVAGGAAASAAVVAAPVVAAVAVGMTADAAVGAYKAGKSFEERVAESEKATKTSNDVDASGGPALQNYSHLRAFAILEGKSPSDNNEQSRQEHAHEVLGHAYSQDLEALEVLEEEIRAKIQSHDEIIEENSSWIPDYTRLFSQDEVGVKMQAQIDRAHYAAALNELKDYRDEVDSFNELKTEHELPPITTYHRVSETQTLTELETGVSVLKEGPWEETVNAADVKEGNVIWRRVGEELDTEETEQIIAGIQVIHELNPELSINEISWDQVLNMPMEGLINAVSNLINGLFDFDSLSLESLASMDNHNFIQPEELNNRNVELGISANTLSV